MIISHKNKFIFQMCRKAAGSSIQIALARHLGPRDLGLGAWVDAHREGVRPNARFYADICLPGSLARITKARLLNGKSLIAGANEEQKLRYYRVLGQSPEHAPAIRVRNFDPQSWDNYFKFCFVRNPFEKAVSDWLWRRKFSNADITFTDWLNILLNDDESKLKPKMPDNWPIYTIDDKISVDFCGRYETLNDDLTQILKRLSLPLPSPLTRAKSAPIRYNYRDYYTARERRMVERLFIKEIDTFKYNF